MVLRPSHKEVGDVRDTLLSMALWFQTLLLASHVRTVKCLSLLASSPLRPTPLFCPAPPSPWLCPSLAVKFEGPASLWASASSSAKQGRWHLCPSKLVFGTIEAHYDLFFFLLPSLCQPGPFGSQTENSTQNGLGKMRMHCSSTTYLHQKKKNAEANLVMGIFLRTGFLSGTWLFPWCWVHLQTLLVIPSPGGKMATLLVHIIPTPNPAVQKVLNMFLNNILGPGSPRPKFGQYSSLKHCRQRPARFGSLGWGHVHPQSWR